MNLVRLLFGFAVGRVVLAAALVCAVLGTAQAGDVPAFMKPHLDFPQLETLFVHQNDFPFGSDGAGPTGSLEFVVRAGDLFAGVGLFGVTPELKVAGSFRARDPLLEKGRFVAWIGREDTFKVNAPALGSLARVDTSVSGRLGAEGGAVDDLAEGARDAVYKLLGTGIRDLSSFNDIEAVAGMSGHARLELPLFDSWGPLGEFRTSVAPFAYGSVGTDVIEAAAGIQLSYQGVDEDELPFLMQSKTGAYAPMFGGNGFSLFALARGVLHDDLYGGLEEAFVLEAGVTAQSTLAEQLVLGFSASCASDLYEGAPKGSCMAAFRSGLRF